MCSYARKKCNQTCPFIPCTYALFLEPASRSEAKFIKEVAYVGGYSRTKAFETRRFACGSPDDLEAKQRNAMSIYGGGMRVKGRRTGKRAPHQ